jgi:hypothetical protein
VDNEKKTPSVTKHYTIIGIEGQLPIVVKDATPDKVSTLRDVKERAQKTQKILSAYFKRVGRTERACQIAECGTFLLFKRWNDPVNTLKLKGANFCTHRYCLMCQYRKSRKEYPKLHTAIQMAENDSYNLQFVTLTIPNVEADLLRPQIAILKKSARALFRSKNCLDYYSNLEKTYNKKTKKFHPHLHLLALFRDEMEISYKSFTYLEKLRQEWYNVLKCNKAYNLRDDVNVALLTTYEQQSMSKANVVCELLKYIVKPDVIQSENIDELISDTKGIQQHSASGVFRTYLRNAEALNELLENQEREYLSEYDYQLLGYLWNEDNYIQVLK